MSVKAYTNFLPQMMDGAWINKLLNMYQGITAGQMVHKGKLYFSST